MTLTNTQLLEFAKTQPPKNNLNIHCSLNWLAAQTATQLSGKEHRMVGWDKFDNFTGKLTYTEVSPEYAEWCEDYNNYIIDNATYATYQDAIDVLETFIEDEEKQLSWNKKHKQPQSKSTESNSK
mgnify:FL=1